MNAIWDKINTRSFPKELLGNLPGVESESQEKAFHEIKEALSKQPVLVYYDVTNPVTILCDASQLNLCAVILQDAKPIEFASRTLTEVETRYALLAVVFAFNRFTNMSMGKK